MARQTSIDAYNKIKEDGLLSKRRWQVYNYVYNHGPCRARQAHKMLSEQGTNSSSFMSRFSELRDMGVLYEAGHEVDPETNQTVIVWEVTANLPKKLIKPNKIKCKHCNGKGYHIQERLF